MNLYVFNPKGEMPVRMTTAKATLTVDGNSYLPTTLQRSKYALDSLGRKNNITVTFPGNNTFARRFITPTTVTLGVNIANLSGQTFFRGLLIAAGYEPRKNTINMVFEPIIRLDRRAMGERRLYQLDCNYLVYDDNCGATRVRHDVTVTAIRDQFTVQLCFDTTNDANAGRGVNRFEVLPSATGSLVNIGNLLGGLVETKITPAVSWWITNINNVTATGRFVYFDVTLFRRHGLTVSQAMTVSFGCKRTVTDCNLLFNNLKRYGGFPALTKQSPFQGGLS